MQSILWRPGVNMREFAYYSADRPFASFEATAHVPSLKQDQAAAAAGLGVRLVRFFASHKDFTTEDSIRRLEEALKVLDQQRIQAIVCLTDNLAESNFFVSGDAAFYREGRLSPDYWSGRLYERNYLPQIIRMAEHFRKDPRIAFWELGNEFAIHPANLSDEQAFLDFAEKASRLLMDASGHHVALGAINSRQLAADKANWRAFTEKLYEIATLDLVGVHFYAHDSEEENAGLDLDVATHTGRPFYVGEMGMEIGTGDRPAYLAKKISTWRDNGAFSVLLWQFDAFHAPNQFPDGLGISDRLGFAKRFDDFDAIVQIVRSHASPPAEPLPLVTTENGFEPRPNLDGQRIAALPVGREGGGEVTAISPPMRYMVLAAGSPLRVRKLPGTDQRILGKLAEGDMFLARASQEFGEHVWLFHETLGQGGWSAERRIDGAERYLSQDRGAFPETLSVTFVSDPTDPPEIRINALPRRGQVIVMHPMSNPRVLQHFGNTRTAFQFFKDGKTWYDFSQDLHAGVDLVTVRGGNLEVRAGVQGEIGKPGGAYAPRRVDVITEGGYRLIYGHLHDESPLLPPGASVEPDTVLGTIALKDELKLHDLFFTPHLHFEARFKGCIINPLPLMPDAIRALYDVPTNWDFCDEGGWSRWLTPYDQPVLRLIPPNMRDPIGPATLLHP